MSVQNRRTTSAVALDELKRRRDLESLRKYLINEQCFPATKDPMTSIITMEELKKLARIWKLNERRNFWKTHSERNEMVAALLEHSEQNKNFISTSPSKMMAKVPSIDVTPMPPIELKPSHQSNRNYFNRENNPTELVISSRFFDFPDPVSNVDHVIDTWRSEDFNMKDESLVGAAVSNRSQSLTAPTPGRHTISTGAAKNKMKMLKHRNLASHLMNYSANTDLQKNPLSLKSVQTFINVAETDDIKTVSNCMIAISNISSNEYVRSLLYEINAMHKFSTFLNYTRGKYAQWAATLLFYYFSCDKEAEDRVHGACSSFLTSNSNSPELDTRLLTLYTMNNLMPCIDRQNAVTVGMSIINGMFDVNSANFDKNLTAVCLLVLQNMSCFSNAHSTLLQHGLLDLLYYFANIAVQNKNQELGAGVVKILNSFLFLPEQAANLVDSQYVHVLTTLLEMDHEGLLVQCMKAATLLSGIVQLKPVVHETNLIDSVAAMVARKQLVSNNLAKDVSKFFANVTLTQTADQLERLVDCKVPDAIFQILRSASVSATLKSVVVRALQNILANRQNCIRLADLCFEPLVKMLREVQDIGAAYALYNISCIPECRNALVENKIHYKMLDLLTVVKELNVKSAYLQILVQMSSSRVCVVDMLNEGLIAKLEAQLKKGHNRDVWKDISTVLLAVVAFAANTLTQDDQVSVIHILEIICVKGTSEEIVENSSNVLKYVSVKYGVFEDLNPVVRSILDLSDKEVVVDSLSTVLYNMTCIPRNVVLMLQDEQYVNIMIRIMRNGKVEVQENIAQAMRTLCSADRCTAILLKNDILSDLIVIALLRTSSEEIKVVCSEAFYNMLCHDSTRLRLLKGDLWWAVMRLCRTDSNAVRKICARALFDLSCDASNIAPLREHHVLSFIKDISISGDEDFVTKCLHSVHNIIRQFPTEGVAAIAVHEVIASVRIGADALCKFTNIKAVKEALILLLKCSQQEMTGTDTEFINLDIVEALDSTKQLWGTDYDCRLYVSRLLWELSKSSFFTKSTTLGDLDPILCAIHSAEHTAGEITDNIAAIFLQFVLREKVPPLHIIQLPIWEALLSEAFTSEYSRANSASSVNNLATVSEDSAMEGSAMTPSSKHNWKARATLYRGDSLSSSEAKEMLKGQSTTSHLSFATRGSVLSILSYSAKEHISVSKSRITKPLITGILTNELLDNPLTRPNLLNIIHALSEVSLFALHLTESDVFRLLSRYLNNSIGTNKQDRAQEFCSTFLHNLSLHASLISKLIASSDGAIDRLLRDILEVPNPNVLLDLTVFFYNVSACLVNNDASLNPKFILEMINKVTAADPDKESMVSSINKYTISIILNMYEFDGGVDPSFVQSMFTYMQNNPTSLIPDYMEQVRFKPYSDPQAVLSPDFIKQRTSISVDLRSFAADTNQWQPTMNTQTKCNQNIILRFTQAMPVVHDKLEACDTYGSPTFSKILKTFEMVRESSVGTDNVALVEGDDEEEDEDDEDSLSLQQGEGDERDLSSDEVESALRDAPDVEGDGEDGAQTEEGMLSGEVVYKSVASPAFKYNAMPPSSLPSPAGSVSRPGRGFGSNQASSENITSNNTVQHSALPSVHGSKQGSGQSSRQQLLLHNEADEYRTEYGEEYSNTSFEDEYA